MRRSAGALLTVVLLTGASCSFLSDRGTTTPPPVPLEGTAPIHLPVLPRQMPALKQAIEVSLRTQQATTVAALAAARAEAPACASPLALRTLTDPTSGLLALERDVRDIAWHASRGSAGLPHLLRSLAASKRPATEPAPPAPAPTDADEQDAAAYVLAVLQQAAQAREQALKNLSGEERRFLFDQAPLLVERFAPQSEGASAEQATSVRDARRVCALISERLDHGALLAAALSLLQLADEDWLQEAARLWQAQTPSNATVPGITGEVYVQRPSPQGWIIVGGTGANRYETTEPVAFLLDLGGDDHYAGTVAAPTDVTHGLSIVIDRAGNDTYAARPLGLATGRLGVGLLFDSAGDDQYRLEPGSGGTGFAGFGILVDHSGRDHYIGTKLTQGAAIGGLGLLLDVRGDDSHTGFGYGQGFGGPGGIGALIDVTGDDLYSCGGKYASAYNETDLPGGSPAHPRFQYDSFCLGAGAGTRVFLKDSPLREQAQGGGMGLHLDLQGHDHYRSDNFSQGLGYFYGIGVKVDHDGQDTHAAARFGHGAAAHAGVGFFIDAAGRDRYLSNGPFYNGGVAWDRGVAAAIDAGASDDIYDFQQSDGLGRADHSSWSLFLDDGGQDRYHIGRGLGTGERNSIGLFVDLGGNDEYQPTARADLGGRGNGQKVVTPPGGLFVDR
jgi:hypothetical protein